MSDNNGIPIFANILSDENDPNPTYRAIVSTLVTALRREEPVLISTPSKLSSKKVAQFVGYVANSLFPSTVSVISKNNSYQFFGDNSNFHENGDNDDDSRNHDKNKSNKPLSPYLVNVCIVEDFDNLSDTSPVIKVMKELAVTIDGADQPTSVPIPFLLVALVNESSHLPRNTLGSFSFHINIQNLPSQIPSKVSPFYPNYDAFVQVLNTQVFVHRDITTYMSQLILNVDCKPLLTSFIEVKTKLLLVKAVDDCTLLHGRNYIITDDVKMIFPMLVTHRFLLPGSTSFKNCVDFINKLIDTLPVPI